MKRRKDYQAKRFKNPLFPKQAARRKRRSGKIIFVLVLLFFLGGLSVIVGSDYFLIKDIRVNGDAAIASGEVQSVIEEQLGERRFFILPQKNIFFFDDDQAIQTLQDQYLLDVLVEKDYPQSIIVTFQTDSSRLIWVVDGKQYYVNADGVVLRMLDAGDVVRQQLGAGTQVIRSETKTGVYPVVYDQSNTSVIVGESATAPEFVRYLIELSEALRQGSGIDVSHFAIERPYSQDVTLVAQSGWQAHLRLGEPEVQVRLLTIILTQKIKDQQNIEYIDLRFGEKIFYK